MTNQERPQFMSDVWEIYQTHVDDAPAAILFDMGICSTVPDVERPILLWMFLKLKTPDVDGHIASDQEEEHLANIEDSFIDAVELTTSGQFVGRVTTAGQRQFYWYAKTADGFEDSIDEAMQAFEEYEYEVGYQDDPEWEQYSDVIYPSTEDMHQIHSAHLIEELEASGDDISAARPVDHEASFMTSEARSAFIAAVKKLGFDQFIEANDSSEDDLKHAVRFQKSHAVDWETIEEVTYGLMDLAAEHEGEYDGWETKPAKN